MILYHGSNVEVASPQVIAPNRALDFGAGFYTTANFEQASNFALRIASKRESGIATVSRYSVDEAALSGCRSLDFPAADGRWLDFVSANRNGVGADEGCDFVHGPIANDDVYRTLLFYFEGLMTRDVALEALKVRKLYNQYVFKTARALAALSFIGSEAVHE